MTPAYGSRRGARTFDANKRLHSRYNQLVVSLAAFWSVHMLHDDVADGTVGGISREGRVDPEDLHTGR